MEFIFVQHNQQRHSMKLQQELITTLAAYCPDRTELVKVLGTLLNLSSGPIYKRLRGKSLFTVKEVASIIQHFDLDANQLFNDLPITNRNLLPSTPQAYIDQLIEKWTKQVEHIVAQKGAAIFMTTSTLPFSLAMQYVGLVKYRLYYMVCNIERYEAMKTLAFDPDSALYRKVPTFCERIHRIYTQLPTTEVWSSITFHSTIRHINLLHRNQQLSTSCFLNLLDELEQLTEQSAFFAKSGNKRPIARVHLSTDAPDYSLYLNDTSGVPEFTILSWYEHEKHKLYVYHPIYGVTEAADIKINIENYCYALRENSRLISTTNVAVRNAFFRKVMAAIEKKRKELV